MSYIDPLGLSKWETKGSSEPSTPRTGSLKLDLQQFAEGASKGKKLSDPNPVPKVIRDQYEEIILNKGVPRVDPRTGKQTVFEGREGQGRAWIGSLEFDVPGTNNRILLRPDGKIGYVLKHDYTKPRLFPSPWYPDGGKK